MVTYAGDIIEYSEIKKIYRRVKGTPITAEKMHRIKSTNGTIRVFAGGATEIKANISHLPDANIIDIPVVIVQSRGVIDFIYCDEPCTFKNEMWGYTSSDASAVKFLFYYLKHNVEYFRNAGDGRSSFSQISLPVTEDYQIPLISSEEQQAIVSVLSDFDQHIDNLAKLIEKKKAIRDGVLDDLIGAKTRVDGFNGEWEEKTLEDICVINGLVRGPFGGSLKKDMFVSQGNKVYEQRNAIYKSVEIGKYYITDEKYSELFRFAVKANDFIVSCSGTIGRIYRIPQNYPKGIINQALLKITIDANKCDLDYFYKYFEWDKFQDEIIDNTQGGAMKNLVGMDVFRNTLIRMPKDIREQQAIASIIKAIDEEIEALEIEKSKMEGIKEGAMDDLLTSRVRLKI